MKNRIIILSVIVMVIALAFMGINWFITPLSDVTVRVIGGILIVNLIVLVYSTVKLRSNRA